MIFLFLWSLTSRSELFFPDLLPRLAPKCNLNLSHWRNPKKKIDSKMGKVWSTLSNQLFKSDKILYFNFSCAQIESNCFCCLWDSKGRGRKGREVLKLEKSRKFQVSIPWAFQNEIYPYHFNTFAAVSYSERGGTENTTSSNHSNILRVR